MPADADAFRARLNRVIPGLGSIIVASFVESLGSKEELEEILLEARLDVVSPDAQSNLLTYVESELPNLQMLRSWWGSVIGQFTEITPIGITIAFSNAKPFDSLEGSPSLSELLGFS